MRLLSNLEIFNLDISQSNNWYKLWGVIICLN